MHETAIFAILADDCYLTCPLPKPAIFKERFISEVRGDRSQGADVRITETEQTQKTDENGTFQFTELPEGTYTFVVTHPTETAPTAVSVSISSGDTTEVKIYLGEAAKLENNCCGRETSTANDQPHRHPRQRTPTHSGCRQ